MSLKKNNFPWFVIVLPVFFILNINNTYFALISNDIFIKNLIVLLTGSLLVLFVSTLLLKSILKAGLFTLFLQILYIFWGSLHDFLKQSPLPSFFTSYKVLLPLVTILAAILFIRLLKTKRPLIKIHRFFLIAGLLLPSMEIVILVFNTTSQKQKEYNPAYYNNPLKVTLDTSSTKPDIFLLILDEYASSEALLKYQKFDNSRLDSLFINKGFYLAKKSKSNYNSTPFSLSSLFNMQFDPHPIESGEANSQNLLRATYSLKKSLLPSLLAKNGYKIMNFGGFNFDGFPTPTKPFFYDYEKKVVVGQTLGQRIKKDILWNLSKVFPKPTSIPVSNATKQNNKNFSLFIDELKHSDDSARFVIGHLMLPHTPFNHDRFGRDRIFTNDDLSYPIYDSLYIDQVIYANTFIDSALKLIPGKTTRPVVLIVMGDHGDRQIEKGKPVIREKQFMNLSAFYFSDGDYKMLYDSISPVNIFRTVLNKYFQTNLPVLKDSTILLIN